MVTTTAGSHSKLFSAVISTNGEWATFGITAEFIHLKRFLPAGGYKIYGGKDDTAPRILLRK